MVEMARLSQDPGSMHDVDNEQNADLAGHELRFRDYRLLPSARILLKGRTPVAIGSRAFDILHVLARSRGCIVGKREIVDCVWPTTIVEESNLRFQVAQLRKALADDQDIIKTIPGRGYLLAVEEFEVPSQPASALEVLQFDGPMLHPCGGSEEAPASGGGICREARVLLEELVRTLNIGEGRAVIVCVRLAQ